MRKLEVHDERFVKEVVKFLFVVYTAVLAGCKGESPTLSEADSVQIESEVRLFFDRYYAAVASGGLTAEFQYLDHSPEFFWVPPGYKHPISYDSVAAVLTQSAPGFVSVKNQLDTLRVIPLTKALATYSAKLRSATTDTSGNISSLNLIETGVVIKRRDGWKLLSGQTAVTN